MNRAPESGGNGGKAGNAEPQLGILKEKAELGLGVPRVDREWYSRGYLPHLDDREKVQSITFRLADSLPREKLEALEEQLATMSKEEAESTRRKSIEQWLDAGLGSCALRHPAVATLMEETLQKFDGDRYRLLAWCVIPNHVHVLIQPKNKLGKIVQSWKSYTGRWALNRNAALGLGVPGKKFWMREYWDRFIRNENHLIQVVDYIHENPVKAGLCVKAEDWPWSSARFYVKNKSGNAGDTGTAGNAEPQLGILKEKAKLGLGAPGNTNEDAKLGLGVPSELKL